MSEKEALLPTKRIFCNNAKMLPLKVRKCAEAPDHLRNEISSRAFATSGVTRGFIQGGKAQLKGAH